ncbi:hypothetical protein [Paenibacillus campi]|uniref:hypothetical protein n=1 Tax=Paenibacillus campi TaxID=3106031 RepID=UPI002AFE5DAA|nr:hypothetical protein [Paenibacillus sp. SGZ-1014]
MMTYRFGVIGPVPSVQRIMQVMDTLHEDVVFVPLVYNHPQEIPELMEHHRHGLKGWFFSGPIPFSIARPYLKGHELAVCCKPSGSALYKGILQMMLLHGSIEEPYSIDMIRSEEMDVQESLAELEPSAHPVHIHLFDEWEEPERIVSFHLELWKAGKSKAALTCMYFVYNELQKQGMPVHRLTMARQDIRQAAQLLIQQARSSYFQDTQIGMQMIEADLLGQTRRGGGRYSVQHAELNMQQRMLKLCEQVDGILVHNGVGSYQIVSTRGAIERKLGRIGQLVGQMELETDMRITVGIGYGNTAFTASDHALRALQHARHNQQRLLVIVQDNGTIRELDRDVGDWSYASRALDAELLERLNTVNISARMYRKIEALTRHMQWDGFTTVQLAQHLSMTIRNAQRIMSNLCQIGLAEIEGEEQQTVRGRPRKIYRLLMNG